MTHGSGVIRATDRPRLGREHPLPDIQRLVDAGNGSRSMAIWRNWLAPGDRIPAHRHTFEEVLVVTKKLVVRERVVVRKETVIDEYTLQTELRREHVSVDADDQIEVDDRRT